MENDSCDAVKGKVLNHNEADYNQFFEDFNDSILTADRLQSKSITKGSSTDFLCKHMKCKIENLKIETNPPCQKENR